MYKLPSIQNTYMLHAINDILFKNTYPRKDKADQQCSSYLFTIVKSLCHYRTEYRDKIWWCWLLERTWREEGETSEWGPYFVRPSVFYICNYSYINVKSIYKVLFLRSWWCHVMNSLIYNTIRVSSNTKLCVSFKCPNSYEFCFAFIWCVS